MKKIIVTYGVDDIVMEYNNSYVSVELIDEEIDKFNMMSMEEKTHYVIENGSLAIPDFKIVNLSLDVNDVKSERIFNEEESFVEYTEE